MNTHELKAWPQYFAGLWDMTKPFELRRNDRNFQVGDELILRGWDPATENYTGDVVARRVCYVISGGPWLADGYVCLGLEFPGLPTARAAQEMTNAIFRADRAEAERDHLAEVCNDLRSALQREKDRGTELEREYEALLDNHRIRESLRNERLVRRLEDTEAPREVALARVAELEPVIADRDRLRKALATLIGEDEPASLRALEQEWATGIEWLPDTTEERAERLAAVIAAAEEFLPRLQAARAKARQTGGNDGA